MRTGPSTRICAHRLVVRTRWWTGYICLLSVLISGPALVSQPASADMATGTSPDGRIPAEAQLPIFFKLLTYDRALADSANDTLHVAITWEQGNDASAQGADEFRKAVEGSLDKTVNGAHITYSMMTITELDSVASGKGVDVVYVPQGLDHALDDLRRFCRENRVLSLTADAQYVRDGLALGLRLEGSRPRIVANLGAIRASGHDFSARVLRVCEIVGGEDR